MPFYPGTSFGLLDTFLFWLLQDLGATRMLMGLTVAVGGLAGIPLLVATSAIITRLGHVNTLVISIAFYVIRFVGQCQVKFTEEIICHASDLHASLRKIVYPDSLWVFKHTDWLQDDYLHYINLNKISGITR